MTGWSMPAGNRETWRVRTRLWRGRGWTAWARLLQRISANEDLYHRRLDRRDHAIRAAHNAGVSRETLSNATGLGSDWIRDILKKDPAEKRAPRRKKRP